MTTQKERDRVEQLERLRELIKPGDTIYTVLRHVSRSGMTRDLDLYVMHDGRDGCEPVRITWSACKVTDRTYNRNAGAMRVGGCGMDMGFDAVYTLSHFMFPEGFGCIGAGCPSNDHSNGDRDYTAHLTLFREHDARMLERAHADHNRTTITWNVLHDAREKPTGRLERDHWHKSGGYALQHRWM